MEGDDPLALGGYIEISKLLAYIEAGPNFGMNSTTRKRCQQAENLVKDLSRVNYESCALWHEQVDILEEEVNVLQQQAVNSNTEVTEEGDTNFGRGLRNIGRCLNYNAMHNNTIDNDVSDNEEEFDEHILMLKTDELAVAKE